MAPPRKQIDGEKVKKLAAIHCTTEEIAVVVGCSKDTLERRFSVEMQAGRAEGRASLRRMQYTKAMEGNITMLIWLGKQLLGQSERVTHEAGESTETQSIDDLRIELAGMLTRKIGVH